ncbi:MAG: Asp-tRNA(Asn)/Glu-tRNA(Gln) amidotransferase subunit GatA [Eubacterium sp.]|nr:Asp-tRNA(Asn)/Glu-tRNA(Gln) amidotransferase subunit GatA [Eubacterium sp.]
MEIYEMTALMLAEKIRSRELTPTEAVLSVADAIKARDEKLNCYTSLDVDGALEAAKNVENAISRGENLSPLAGVPIGIKDDICELGRKATAGSKMLSDFTAPYNAIVIDKIKSAGMIPLGRLNMDEFAMGWSTETSHFGAVKNPWDLSRTAGGSSGGSAAAVAADECVIALGTDTGGSIRQPCAFCGVTGLKPTYGAVSRYGLIAFASSLDVIGPVGKTARDTAALFSIIKGADSRDMTSRDSEDITLSNSLKGVKIGVPTELFGCDINGEVRENIVASKKVFESLGAECVEVSLSLLKYAGSAYYIIACAEASSNLARYDGVRFGHRATDCDTLEEMYIKSRSEGFGAEVKKRIMLGNFVLSAGYFDDYYNRALKVKRLICDAFDDAFNKCDIILSPVTSSTAYRLGESPTKMYLDDTYTSIVNLAGLPALSLPCGFDSEGMPTGLQLIGRAFDEKSILSAGALYQSCTDFHLKKPRI